MIDKRVSPIAVRSPYKATSSEIDWADGHKGVYPHDILRGYCPCAGCQGHSGEIRFVPGGQLDIKTIEQVGEYALSFEWGDGHATGIYTFRFLRSLCQCAECVPREHLGERPVRARL